MAPPLEGAVAVAVGAYNIALCDFLEDSVIRRTPGHMHHECALRSRITVVELHHKRGKAAPAVSARYAAQPPEHLDLTDTDRRLGG